MQIGPYHPQYRDAVIALWQAGGLVVPDNAPGANIDAKFSWQPELFFAGVEDGVVIGSVMADYDGHRGWINYLAVLPEKQGHWYGRALMQQAEQALAARGCPKVNLQIRPGTNE